MGLNAKKIPSGGSNFKRPPALDAGTYPGRLVQIIDCGLQEQRAYQGQDKPPKPEIYTTYELLDEFLLDEDGNEVEDKPRWISETLPMHSLDSDLAKSTKRYLALDPLQETAGDWSKLVGYPAMITISADKDKKGKKDDDGNPVVYNNISSVQTMREKDAKKAGGLVNPPKVFDMEEPDLDVFLSLPDWLRDKIKSALDFEGGALEGALSKIDEKAEIAKRREKNKEAAEKAKADAAEEDQEEYNTPDNDEEDW